MEKEEKKSSLEHFQTDPENGSSYQNGTVMSTSVRYVTSSDTNAHFTSVIHDAY